eukprot:COSAG01_NODE_9273_length_2496_cov_2.047559_3_plen_131_part_00
MGLLTLFSGLFKVGQQSKVTGREITPLYAYTNMVAAGPAFALFAPLIMANWIYALQCGGALAVEALAQMHRVRTMRSRDERRPAEMKRISTHAPTHPPPSRSSAACGHGRARAACVLATSTGRGRCRDSG